MKNLKKEEIKSLIREAIDKANLEEGWLDRLKARAASMGKGEEKKATAKAGSLVDGFKKKALRFLMDLEMMVGDNPKVQKLIKSVETQTQNLVASLDDMRDEFVGADWFSDEPSDEAEEYEPDSETGQWSARKRQDIEAKRLRNFKRKMALKRREHGLPPRKGDAELLAPMRGLRGRPAGQARKRKLAQARASAARVPRPMTEDRNE